MKHLVVDRIENGFAVCEDEARNMIDIPIITMPVGFKEGDVINIDDKGVKTIDIEETRKRREFATELLKNLFDN